MDSLNKYIIQNIYDYIPLKEKKFVNKESYNLFLKTFYPVSIEDWLPITVYNNDFRNCVNNMFLYIVKNNLQSWFFNFHPENKKGYMGSNDPIMDQIYQGVEEDGHSGSTFCYCLRIMQDIFKNKKFSEWFIINNKIKYLLNDL